MIYAWICSNCGARYDHPHHPENPCPLCGGQLRRDWRHVAVRRPFEPHFNHSIGEHVRSHGEFTDALKRKGEEVSERLGIEHRFVEADPTNCGAGPDEATERANRASRGAEPTRRIFG
jgi:hypothetical protein